MNEAAEKNTLIILDGSTEHSAVTKRIIQRAGECCSTLVTCLAHLSRNIEQYFKTIVWLQGFTYDQALNYCAIILQQNARRQELVRLYINNFTRYIHYVSPMLLLFVCILDDTVFNLPITITVGEIFFRLIKFAYKKHVSAKQLDWGKFERFFEDIGKVALICLTENSHSFSKKELGDVLCTEAFNSGIVAELRRPSLILDSFDDSLLCFVHSSFKYFFGAYSLVQSIGTGTLEKGLQNSMMTLLLHHPLLSHFAIWFTNDGFQQSSENQRRAYSRIKTLVVDKIDIIELDFSRICKLYPTINI